MPISVDRALRNAQNQIKAGEPAKAEELCKQVLSKFPKNKKAIQSYQKLRADVAQKVASEAEPSQEEVQELISLYARGQFEEVLSKVKPLINTSFTDEERTVIWQTINVEHECTFCVPAHTAMAKHMKIDD